MQPTLQWLHSNGVGGILDYAAEDDTKPEKPEKKENSASSASSDQVVARRFDYETEARCDQHMEAFKRSIAAAAEAPGQGFAAIKVGTSLCFYSGPEPFMLLCIYLCLYPIFAPLWPCRKPANASPAMLPT